MLKKMILVTVVIFCAIAVYAEGATNQVSNTNNLVQLENIIKKGRINSDKELEQVKNISTSASENERNSLYNKYEKNIGHAFLGFALNTFLLPSLGSFVIGDMEGATRTLLGFGISGGMCLLGFGLHASIQQNTRDDTMYLISGWVLLAGVAGFGIVEIINIFSPFFYVPDWNYKLKTGLKISFFDQNPKFKPFCINNPQSKNISFALNLLTIEY